MSTVDPDHRVPLARLLFGDTDGNLGLVTHQNYVLGQMVKKQNASTSALCQSELDATKEAIRKNWSYLRGVNLNATDLSYSPLYSADFARSIFFRASLQGANLRCANLVGVRLEGSLGWEMADFTFANVIDLLPVNIREFALDHGALQMPDHECQAWRSNDFRVETGKPVLNGATWERLFCRPIFAA
jgi:Pentapeptide repeats (8 copies)